MILGNKKMSSRIGIIGLGYVGLPLAICFGQKFKTIGFDIDEDRINDLKKNYDYTNEVTTDEFISSKYLSVTNDLSELSQCNVYIITVPTPIDTNNKPDLNSLKKASEIVGGLLKKDDLVIYESTVYPGATEEVCVPILEAKSSSTLNQDFHVGYSPERINPGDKERGLQSITKVTSGSSRYASDLVHDLYNKIIKAGIYRASSIKVAEAAKVIENTQRDLNIALMNELSKVFYLLKIDTTEVLKAASTKWNFINFSPGLVGGHCIGVDPYYLTHKAQAVGYEPDVILSGRKINDSMGRYIANQIVKGLSKKKINPLRSNILLMGFTFKENCPDVRNTKVVDIVSELQDFGLKVDVYDPIAHSKTVKIEYGVELISKPKINHYDAVVLAVAHNCFRKMGLQEVKKFGNETHIFFDLKSVFEITDSDFRL